MVHYTIYTGGTIVKIQHPAQKYTNKSSTPPKTNPSPAKLSSLAGAISGAAIWWEHVEESSFEYGEPADFENGGPE